MDTYYELNPYWKKLPPHPADFRANLLFRIKLASEHDLAVGYYRDNQLSVVSVMLPMDVYLSSKAPTPKHPESEIYQVLAPHFADLDNSMIASLTGRKALMFDILAANRKLATTGVPMTVDLVTLEEQAKRGYKEAYARVTNPAGLRVTTRFGGKLLKEITIEEGKLKGLSMYALHLQDIEATLRPKL